MKPKPKKLLDRVRDRIRLKQYSHKTEHAYLNWIRRYILFHKKCTQKKWAQEIWKKKKISRFPPIKRELLVSNPQIWSGREDSNLRPLAPHSAADVSTAYHSVHCVHCFHRGGTRIAHENGKGDSN